MNPMRILPVLVSGALLAGCAGAPESAPQAESVVIEKPKQPATPVPAPVVTYEVALQRGDQAWKSGELDKALMNYVQAASLDRKSALPLLRMASIHEQRKEWPLARQAFEEALKRSPDNAAAQERYGFLLLREGTLDKSDQAFNAALKIDANRGRAVMGLGLAAQRRRDFDAARTHFDAALGLRPNDPELLTYSAELWLQTGGYAQGLGDVRRSLEFADVGATRMLLGDLLARSGDYAGALEAFLASMDEPRAYLRLGEEAMRSRDYERAVRYFRQCQDASPTYNELAAKRLAVARERLAEAQVSRALPPGTRPVSSAAAWQARTQ